jgi:hypothetical protein
VPYAQKTSESSGQQEASTGTGTVYRIVVRGELSSRYGAAFEGMEMGTKYGQTVLTGEVKDPPHLHGILDRISSFGLELLSVTCVTHEPRNETQSNPQTPDDWP